MQNALYSHLPLPSAYPSAPVRTSAVPVPGALRWLARRWDLIAVLTLMGTSAAYGAFVLTHLGL